MISVIAIGLIARIGHQFCLQPEKNVIARRGNLPIQPLQQMHAPFTEIFYPRGQATAATRLEEAPWAPPSTTCQVIDPARWTHQFPAATMVGNDFIIKGILVLDAAANGQKSFHQFQCFRLKRVRNDKDHLQYGCVA